MKMTKELAVRILKDMLDDYKDGNFMSDQEALKYAIKKLTAPEVPVQEQQINKIVDKRINRYKKFQIIIVVLQTISMLIFEIGLIIR